MATNWEAMAESSEQEYKALEVESERRLRSLERDLQAARASKQQEAVSAPVTTRPFSKAPGAVLGGVGAYSTRAGGEPTQPASSTILSSSQQIAARGWF